MEKKSKKTIIIGITSLFLVTLILLGLTYAYYRTRIIGNTADTSLSVLTEGFEISFEDGTSSMNMTGKIEPGFTASKTFYVNYLGSSDVKYSVILDEITNEFMRNQDWQVTLTKNGENVISTSDNVYLAVGTHQVLLERQTIAAPADGETSKDTYVLTVTYVDSDENQSIDMGKNLKFRVNIMEEQYAWNNAPEGSLLFALKNNKPNGADTTTPGRQLSTQNEARIVEVEDDYGTSYVYRGNVTNNYVNYSGMCWRIVRVQGDGTIKLVLADEKGECNAETYTVNDTTSAYISNLGSVQWSENGGGVTFADSNISAKINTWKDQVVIADNGEVIRNNMLDTSLLVNTAWCDDRSIASYNNWGYDMEGNIVYDSEEATSIFYINYNYGAYERISNKESANPTLKCNMTGAIRYEGSVGLLTIDELAFAGSVSNELNTNSYIYTNANDDYYFWTMSAKGYDDPNGMDSIYASNMSSAFAYESYMVRPAIVLKSTVIIDEGADGTYSKPYIVK